MAEQFRTPWLSDVVDLLKRDSTNRITVGNKEFVLVVRCKDCKWWKTNYFWEGHEHKICVRESHESLRNAEDYCSYGERREVD